MLSACRRAQHGEAESAGARAPIPARSPNGNKARRRRQCAVRGWPPSARRRRRAGWARRRTPTKSPCRRPDRRRDGPADRRGVQRSDALVDHRLGTACSRRGRRRHQPASPHLVQRAWKAGAVHGNPRSRDRPAPTTVGAERELRASRRAAPARQPDQAFSIEGGLGSEHGATTACRARRPGVDAMDEGVMGDDVAVSSAPALTSPARAHRRTALGGGLAEPRVRVSRRWRIERPARGRAVLRVKRAISAISRSTAAVMHQGEAQAPR